MGSSSLAGNKLVQSTNPFISAHIFTEAIIGVAIFTEMGEETWRTVGVWGVPGTLSTIPERIDLMVGFLLAHAISFTCIPRVRLDQVARLPLFPAGAPSHLLLQSNSGPSSATREPRAPKLDFSLIPCPSSGPRGSQTYQINFYRRPLRSSFTYPSR